MKRKITFLTSIFMIAMVLFTSSVFAAETFTHEGSTYVIDEVKLKTDSLEDYFFTGEFDENGNHIIEDFKTEKLYRVNENECIPMSNQEMLQFRNKKRTYIVMDSMDQTIYEQEEIGFTEPGFIKTRDTEIDTTKMYFTFEKNEFDQMMPASVSNPNVEDIGNYYEQVILKWPESTEIDNNIIYYTMEDVTIGTFAKVENPITDDVYKYRIIVEEQNNPNRTVIEKLDKTKFEDNLEQCIPMMAYYDSEEDEMYFSVDKMDKTILYKTDGTKIKEFDELMFIRELGNKFFIAFPNINLSTSDTTAHKPVIILDKKGNIVFESKNIPDLVTRKSKDYISYLIGLEPEGPKPYNMYEYKLLSEDNQKYEAKDLTIKTSGELNRLNSVKVNGVELDASNYTKTSGSTIVTLKNDYLKTLAIGTYTLELGYVDGTKIETKFVVDQIFSSDTENEGNTGNVSGAGNAGSVEGPTGEAAGGTIDEDKGDKDDTPKTGNATGNSNLGLYIVLIITAVGVSVIRKK